MLTGSKIKLKFILIIFTAKLGSQDQYIHASMWPLVDSNSSLLTQETDALRGRLQSVRQEIKQLLMGIVYHKLYEPWNKLKLN